MFKKQILIVSCVFGLLFPAFSDTLQTGSPEALSQKAEPKMALSLTTLVWKDIACTFAQAWDRPLMDTQTYPVFPILPLKVDYAFHKNISMNLGLTILSAPLYMSMYSLSPSVGTSFWFGGFMKNGFRLDADICFNTGFPHQLNNVFPVEVKSSFGYGINSNIWYLFFGISAYGYFSYTDQVHFNLGFLTDLTFSFAVCIARF